MFAGGAVDFVYEVGQAVTVFEGRPGFVNDDEFPAFDVGDYGLPYEVDHGEGDDGHDIGVIAQAVQVEADVFEGFLDFGLSEEGGVGAFVDVHFQRWDEAPGLVVYGHVVVHEEFEGEGVVGVVVGIFVGLLDELLEDGFICFGDVLGGFVHNHLFEDGDEEDFLFLGIGAVEEVD